MKAILGLIFFQNNSISAEELKYSILELFKWTDFPGLKMYKQRTKFDKLT